MLKESKKADKNNHAMEKVITHFCQLLQIAFSTYFDNKNREIENEKSSARNKQYISYAIDMDFEIRASFSYLDDLFFIQNKTLIAHILNSEGGKAFLMANFYLQDRQ